MSAEELTCFQVNAYDPKPPGARWGRHVMYIVATESAEVAARTVTDHNPRLRVETVSRIGKRVLIPVTE